MAFYIIVLRSKLNVLSSVNFKYRFITPPRNRGGVIFSLQFVYVSVCLCVCVRLLLWTKFQPNGWTDLDAVFAKWLLTALARTLLLTSFFLYQLCYVQSKWNYVYRLDIPLVNLCLNLRKIEWIMTSLWRHFIESTNFVLGSNT